MRELSTPPCLDPIFFFFNFINSALQCFNQGVVVTSQPLQDDELFEVRLDSKVPKWFGSLDIGATTVPADQLQFPSTITSCSQGTTFALTSDKIVNNGKEMTTVSKNLDNLSVSPFKGSSADIIWPGNTGKRLKFSVFWWFE